jgi:hypothetical protein
MMVAVCEEARVLTTHRARPLVVIVVWLIVPCQLVEDELDEQRYHRQPTRPQQHLPRRRHHAHHEYLRE